MESLFRQLQRGPRGPAQDIGGVDQGIGRRTGPRKSVSFDDGDRTKSKSHYEKQYYHGLESSRHHPSDGEYEAAVAAATYAINSLPDEGFLSKERPVGGVGMERTTRRSKSYVDDTLPRPVSDAGKKITRWLSGAKDDSLKDETGKLMRTPSGRQKRPEKGMGDARTIKWVPSLSDKYLNDEGSKKGREEKATLPPPPPLPKGKPSLPPVGSRKGNGATTQAGSWERAEMDKIGKRYDKMISTILEWENGKKTKAKHKWEKKERKIEGRRAKALQQYKDDITKIDKIAGGARALAGERKRNDESKMRDRSKERRLMGKRSSSCFLF